jgi:hypothetical protein
MMNNPEAMSKMMSQCTPTMMGRPEMMARISQMMGCIPNLGNRK